MALVAPDASGAARDGVGGEIRYGVTDTEEPHSDSPRALAGAGVMAETAQQV